ncbi:protein asteroid homolog 1-like [Dendronephthya gigantea]|uniref:protein asteroid homolog 1-like n=1 Tax=Dendronephthya gigantea TaxID=151771 RepID=UPI00106C6BD8|nr:protein asteroid homolog 1-like isoform X2 [Dendronephthya gigantea]XP_028395550.1 protein asteroid homolog 1-like isoform X2 [Dendronephthya gigantea]XP_028395551.1 protein asteroid homolog 1-like [Dendronephthya gigantea]
MGVRGLTKYVDTLPCGKHGVWEFDELRDTNLIIDGCGLYYHIYNDSNHLNIKYGGQYKQLQDKVKEFIVMLQSNNVVPYVVIDGIMTKDEKKFHTSLKRNQDRVKQMEDMWGTSSTSDMVIPLLVQIAFVQVLQELGVKYAVADFEADCEIASLANELDAPVMAKDSDFYIFNIKGGYIPFQQYNFSCGNITVKKFKFQNFAKYLGIDPGMLPLLASLIGNDYVSHKMLQPFMDYLQQPTDKIPAIAKFLSKCKRNAASTVFEAVVELIPSVQPEFEQALRLSVEEYQMKESNLIGYFSSNDLSCNIVTFNNHSLPQWAVQLFRDDSIASSGFACLCNRKIFLQTQCEDPSLPSAQACVQDLRWHYYAMLQHFENADSGRELGLPQSKAGAESLVTETHQQSHPSVSRTDTGLTKDTPHLVEMIEEFQIQDDAETSLSNTPCRPHQDIYSPLECTNRETNFSKEITVTEFDRKGSTLAEKERKVDLTQIKIQIDGIREMSNEAKKSHLLKLLDSDLPFIHNLAIEHQLVVAALRYWIINCDVNEKQLAAILVHYVGEKPQPLKPNKSLQPVHCFSQWQNVVYWTEKLNSLFSAPFPHLQAAKLYNGIQVCLVHETLISEEDVKAEFMVIYPDLYRLLHNAITKDIRDDWQFKPAKDEKKTTSKDYLKRNPFAVLGELDSD